MKSKDLKYTWDTLKHTILTSFVIFFAIALLESYAKWDASGVATHSESYNAVILSIILSYSKGVLFLFLLARCLKKMTDEYFPIKLGSVLICMCKAVVPFMIGLFPIILLATLIVSDDTAALNEPFFNDESGMLLSTLLVILCLAFAYAVSIIAFVRFIFQSQIISHSKAYGVNKKSNEGYENGYLIPFRSLVATFTTPSVILFVLIVQVIMVFVAGYSAASGLGFLSLEMGNILSAIIRTLSMTSYLFFIPLYYRSYCSAHIPVGDTENDFFATEG